MLAPVTATWGVSDYYKWESSLMKKDWSTVLEKKCPKCLEIKPRDSFSFQNKVTGKLSSYCKTCQYEHQKQSGKSLEYQRKYNRLHKEKVLIRHTRIRKSKRENRLKLLAEEYGGLVCKKCGYDKTFTAIHFHHIDSRQKEHSADSLNKWIKNLSHSGFIEKIKTIKMIPLCANCHAELHEGLWEL